MNLFWVVLEKRRYVKKYNENRIDGREGGNRNVNYSASIHYNNNYQSSIVTHNYKMVLFESDDSIKDINKRNQVIKII